MKIFLQFTILSVFLTACGGGGDSSSPKRIQVERKICEFFGASNFESEEPCLCPENFTSSEGGYFCVRSNDGSGSGNNDQVCLSNNATNKDDPALCDCFLGFERTSDGYNCQEVKSCIASNVEAVNSGDQGQCQCNSGYVNIDRGFAFDCEVVVSQACDSIYATNNGQAGTCNCISGYSPSNNGYSCEEDVLVCFSAFATNLGMTETCNCISGYNQTPNNPYSCTQDQVCNSVNASNTGVAAPCQCNSEYKATADGYNCLIRVCEAPTNREASNSGKVGTCDCNVGYLSTDNGYNCSAVPICTSFNASNRNSAEPCQCDLGFQSALDGDNFNYTCEQLVCNDANALNNGSAGSCVCNSGFESAAFDGFSTCYPENTLCLDSNASNQASALPCVCNEGFGLSANNNGFCEELFDFNGFNANGEKITKSSSFGSFDEVLISRDEVQINDPLNIAIKSNTCLLLNQNNYNLISYSKENSNHDLFLNLELSESVASLKRASVVKNNGIFESAAYQDLTTMAFSSCVDDYLTYSNNNGQSIELSLSLDNRYLVLKFNTNSNSYTYLGVKADQTNQLSNLPGINEDFYLADTPLESSFIYDYNGIGNEVPTYAGISWGKDNSINQSSNKAFFLTTNNPPSQTLFDISPNNIGANYRLLVQNFSVGNVALLLGEYNQTIIYDQIDSNCQETKTEPPYDCTLEILDIQHSPKVGNNINNLGYSLIFNNKEGSQLINFSILQPDTNINQVQEIIYSNIESSGGFSPTDINSL